MSAITDGYGGLEVPHKWYTPFGGTLLATLNDMSVTPHVKLTRIGGLSSRPERESNREDHVGRDGQDILASYARSRTITYEGILRAKTLSSLNLIRDALLYAFDYAGSDEGVMKPGPDFFYNASVTACEIPDEQTNGPEAVYRFQRSFTLGLLQSDPRVYWKDPIVSTGNANAASVTISNTGATTHSYPTFTVHNSGAVVTLENTAIPGSTAGHARLRFNDLPDGTLTVDFFNREAYVDGVNVSAKLASTTDWWDDGKKGVVPGDNTLKVTAESDSTWDVTVYQARV